MCSENYCQPRKKRARGKEMSDRNAKASGAKGADTVCRVLILAGGMNGRERRKQIARVDASQAK